MPTSPLLALPPELRQEIYKQLLYPAQNPRKLPVTKRGYPLIAGEKAYDPNDDDNTDSELDEDDYDEDRQPWWGKGWGPSCHLFDIHPAILRVSKQVYFEAVPLLYMDAVCYIRLSAAWGRGFEDLSGELEQSYERRNITDRANEFSKMNPVALWSRRYSDEINIEMDMNLRCLPMMQAITISTSWSDIFGKPLCNELRFPDGPLGSDGLISGPVFACWCTPTGHHFTPEGELILQILQYLERNQIPALSPTKRLHINLRGGTVVFLAALLRYQDCLAELKKSEQKNTTTIQGFNRLKRMVTLLKSLKQSRQVTVEERWSDEACIGMQEWKREVDLESLAWIETREAKKAS